MPSGTALAELNPRTKEINKSYQALKKRAPWGVGGKDMEAAEDLLKKAKEARKMPPIWETPNFSEFRE